MNDAAYKSSACELKNRVWTGIARYLRRIHARANHEHKC